MAHDVPTEALDLDRFERWMLTAVRHPGGLEAGLEEAQGIVPLSRLEDLVEPSARMTASERLSIYARMYGWRLVDILIEDFPAVRHALDGAFSDVALDYLRVHPSRHYSLSRLGAWFPAYLATRHDLPDHAFLADLARLELTMDLVFDEREDPPLSPEAVRAVPPEQWADAQLRPIAALRLLAFEWPVSTYLQAVIDEQEPVVPEPQATWLVVFRSDYDVWRAPLDREQHGILSALASGSTLGDALEAAALLPGVDYETMAGSLGSWFQKWTEDGYFTQVSLPSSDS